MFNNLTNGYSLSDIAAVTGNSGRSGSDGMFGGEGYSWWIIILFLFVFCGWGNNGFGGGSNRDSGSIPSVREDISYSFDVNDVQNGIRGIQQGLCDGFYAMNTGMLNGFSQLQNSTNQGFTGLNTAILTNGYETNNAINSIGTQLASCCCDIREGISGVNYNLATQANSLVHAISDGNCATQRQIERGFCDTQYRDATNTTTIVQNAHNDTDRIIARLDAMESARQADKIAELQNENQSLKFAASQQAQNNYLVNQLRPCPTPAYITCNPWGSYAPYGSCYGNGCNCG